MHISPRLETSKIDGNWRHLHDSGKSRPPISQYFSDTTGNHGSHTNLVLAMPSPMEHRRPCWTLSIYHARMKTGSCGVTFLLPPPNSTSRHSQARGAILTWNPTSSFLASSDDCMRRWCKLPNDWCRVSFHIFPPQKRFMLIQFV